MGSVLSVFLTVTGFYGNTAIIARKSTCFMWKFDFLTFQNVVRLLRMLSLRSYRVLC